MATKANRCNKNVSITSSVLQQYPNNSIFKMITDLNPLMCIVLKNVCTLCVLFSVYSHSKLNYANANSLISIGNAV